MSSCSHLEFKPGALVKAEKEPGPLFRKFHSTSQSLGQAVGQLNLDCFSKPHNRTRHPLYPRQGSYSSSMELRECVLNMNVREGSKDLGVSTIKLLQNKEF